MTEYHITYLDTEFSGGVSHAVGQVTLIERDGKVVTVVVEEADGAATFIPAERIIAFQQL